MSAFHFTFSITIIVAVLLSCVCSYDPSDLQDFCVGIEDSDATVFVNGKICKDPKTVTADDFYYTGLVRPANITHPLGSKLTQVFISQMPALNSLGIALVRIDIVPGGLNPPHEHPRASEIVVVIEGKLYVGFIASNPVDPKGRSKLYAKVLYPGDVFVFPKGMIHFQYNVGETHAVAIASFNGQNPGVVALGRTMFGSDPLLDPEIVAKAFQMEKEEVKHLQSLPWTGNN